MLVKNCRLSLFGLLALLFVLMACGEEQSARSSQGVYFWQNDVSQLKQNADWLTNRHIDKVYLRIFDLDAVSGQIVPVGAVQNTQSLGDFPIAVVPVVFITQPALELLRKTNVDTLAKRIVRRSTSALQSFTVLQIDADWTKNTRIPYFALLEALKREGKQYNIEITCTLRLHQLSESAQREVPPVATATLLCYHLGDLATPNNGNSIFTAADLKMWLNTAKKRYPLPLEVALPMYGWSRLYRDDKLVRLLPDIRKMTLPEACVQSDKNRFVVQASTWLDGHALYENDIIMTDTVTWSALDSAAVLLENTDAFTQNGRVLYHLDSSMLQIPVAQTAKWLSPHKR